MTEAQIQELHDAFNLFDKDKSGSITIHELSNVMNSLGFRPTKQQLLDMVLYIYMCLFFILESSFPPLRITNLLNI